MAYRETAWAFSEDGKSWTAVTNESAMTSAIPLPEGVIDMLDVKVEMAPSRRPLVSWRSSHSTERFAAFWDGQAFVKLVKIGYASAVHADAEERIYALNQDGLTEYDGSTELVRGSLPFEDRFGTEPVWTVSADGTVHRLRVEHRRSPVAGGDDKQDLLDTSLPHGTLRWSADVLVTSARADTAGLKAPAFVAAPDGSLHAAYTIPLNHPAGGTLAGIYLRSKDGKSWASEVFMSLTSKATGVDDVRAGNIDDDPNQVIGEIQFLAAQDYDHASITMGSWYPTSRSYHLRRCAPFDDGDHNWPSELLYRAKSVAVDERGLASFLSYDSVRQDVPTP